MKFLRRSYLLFIPLFTLLVYYLYLTPTPSPSEPVHYHAGFKVYLDGVLQDFSGYEFMNYQLCTDHDKVVQPRDEQIEKAHLHDGIGDVVHVHRLGATWGDLFANLSYPIPNKPIVGYEADDPSPLKNVLDSSINPSQSLIILIGDNQALDPTQFVTQEHILEVEAMSELCGDN